MLHSQALIQCTAQIEQGIESAPAINQRLTAFFLDGMECVGLVAGFSMLLTALCDLTTGLLGKIARSLLMTLEASSSLTKSVASPQRA